MGAGILRNAYCGMRKDVKEYCNLRKIKCGTFRKLPIITFPRSAAEIFRISADLETTVHSHCTTDLQLMYTSVRCPVVPSFCILCSPFAKEQGTVVFLQFQITSMNK